MKNALILHGTDFEKVKKQRKNNWFPWLKKELEKKGYQVWLPELPVAWKPNFKRYFNFINKHKFNFNKETILIGHSSGPAVILQLLQHLPEKLKINKAILVSPFYKDEGWNCQGLFISPFDFPKIKSKVRNIYIIHSLDDPYVKPQHAYFLQKKLDCKLYMRKKQGHFNLETGKKYKKFTFLLNLI
ncbi:RBBP9/YdeN family alpha/beta hydrolase [Patescibacteria group bacterium]